MCVCIYLFMYLYMCKYIYIYAAFLKWLPAADFLGNHDNPTRQRKWALPKLASG